MGGISISFFVMGISIATSSLWLFLIARSFSGLVPASQSVAFAALSDLSTQENKATHLSYVVLVPCLWFVLGPLVGGVFSTSNYFTPFIYSGIAAAIAFLWIFYGFKKTHREKTQAKIELKRIYQIFTKAYQEKPFFLLCFVFLFMQISLGLFLPIILIFFSTQFNYSPLLMGLYNAYLGVGFALGLLVILPRLVKRYAVERLCVSTLACIFVIQSISGCLSLEIPQWILGFFYAVFVQITYFLMFTAFSNAASKHAQGWIMDLSVAMMAIAWAFAGFGPNSIPLISSNGVIILGGLFLGISFVLMWIYTKKYLNRISHKNSTHGSTGH